MDNDIDTLSNSELQPCSEGMSELAPLSPSPDTWGNTDVLTNREIDEYQRQPQTPTLWGSPLPPGTSKQQVDAVLGQLGGAFMADLNALGYPAHMISATVQFLTANATKAPYQVTRQHNFNLHEQDDWLGNAFGNMVQGLSGSPRAKQGFITAAITWLAKVTAKLNKPGGSGDMPRTAPSTSSEAMLSRLSDSDYNKVVKINEQAQQRTLQTLSARHGEYTAKNMVALAQSHLEKLTPAEQAHFDQFTTVNGVNWVHLMNCAETIEFLYNASVGSGTLPTSSADINKEIAEFEAMLKIPGERARYMRDPQLQARLRELYSRRGG